MVGSRCWDDDCCVMYFLDFVSKFLFGLITDYWNGQAY